MAITKRAFTNGKMNLATAESIINIIESDNETAHKIALSQYKGKIYKQIIAIRNEVMTMLQDIEATLEFPDEVGHINENVFLEKITTTSNQIQHIINQSDYGTYIKNGIRILIIGEPNVGKSSILNALSGEDRSIVSNQAGTTRDYIDITIEINNIKLTLIDTAGLRNTSNQIEQFGIEKIKELAKSVDAYAIIYDGSIPITDQKYQHPSFIDPTKPTLSVINKLDILHEKNKPYLNNNAFYSISSVTQQGLTELKKQ